MKFTPLIAEILNTAYDSGHECLLATVSDNGRPQVSPKGSLAVYDDATLCYWERAHRSARANLSANNRVTVYFRNAERMHDIPFNAGALRLHGTARISADPEVRTKVWSLISPFERERDRDSKGVAILIDVDLVEELTGAVVMAAD